MNNICKNNIAYETIISIISSNAIRLRGDFNKFVLSIYDRFISPYL